jgi:hypothetical protein
MMVVGERGLMMRYGRVRALGGSGVVVYAVGVGGRGVYGVLATASDVPYLLVQYCQWMFLQI